MNSIGSQGIAIRSQPGHKQPQANLMNDKADKIRAGPGLQMLNWSRKGSQFLCKGPSLTYKAPGFRLGRAEEIFDIYRILRSLRVQIERLIDR